MRVQITVKEGTCQGGIHTPDQVYLVDETTPQGMCLSAWDAVSPYVTALLYGGNFPWERKKGYALIHCPDIHGITLELRRIK